MKRSKEFAVLALVGALGLAWAVRVLNSGNAREPHLPDRKVSHAAPEVSRARREEPNSRWRDGASKAEGEQGRRGAGPEVRLEDQRQLHASHAPTLESARQGPSRHEAEAQLRDADEAHGVDFSVVGRPFPVSNSLLKGCAPTAESRPSRRCQVNRKLLDEMAEEPRAEPWASAAEQAIRNLVELEPGTEMPRQVTYTIRALECRTSICFVETASIMSGFHTQFYYFESTSGLRAQFPIDANETDEYGAKVHVTLLPFVRR